LPGGRVSFVTVKGGFPASGIINEDGTYQIKAPIGEVNIGVDNNMLRSPSRGKGASSGPPKGMSHPKPPGAATEAKEQPVKGTWMNIPSQYADPGASGLTYTVKAGSQTHDIELSANPTPVPRNLGLGSEQR